MRRRPTVEEGDRPDWPIPPAATGIALGLWIALMLILAFVVVPILFGMCAPPPSAPAP
ncbi:MAG TPA: hypothetical protein VJP45_05475 [Candidatus Limnocylindria bacterium]|nr:hypothetical protein [Candidatus Limnocylindria bacterium]